MKRITLRRSRVSEAMRPLLGKPRRISFLSGTTLLLSTFPLTTVRGDAEEEEEEQIILGFNKEEGEAMHEVEEGNNEEEER